MGHFVGWKEELLSAGCVLALLGGAVSVIGLIPKLPLLLNPRWTEVRLPKRCFMTEFPSKSAFLTPQPHHQHGFQQRGRFILPDVASPARTHSFGGDGRTLGFHILCLFKSGLGSPGLPWLCIAPPRDQNTANSGIQILLLAGENTSCRDDKDH